MREKKERKEKAANKKSKSQKKKPTDASSEDELSEDDVNEDLSEGLVGKICYSCWCCATCIDDHGQSLEFYCKICVC